MLSPVRVTPPAETPVSWEEADAHLRLDGDVAQQPFVEALIQAATDHLDGYAGILGRALVTQDWRLDLGFFGYPIRLPLAPVQNVGLEIKYWDTANADATVPPADYALHSDALGPYVELVSGASWPSAYARRDAVRVTFTAGYGDATKVPAPIKQAILLMVGDMYQNREGKIAGGVQINPTVDRLLTPYRRWSV